MPKFNEETLFGSLDNKKNNTKEIKMNDTLKITATTVTPLLQIGDTGTQRKMYVYENGERGQVPFFSANGLRGAIRRVATRQQLRASTKAKEITPESFYLLTSGASLGQNAIDTTVTHENINRVREQFPILSLFGAGLSAIEGKIAVSNLFPSSDMERIGYTEDGKPYSLITGRDTYFRVDSIKNEGLWRTLIDVDDVKRWNEDYLKAVAQSKSDKKAGKEEKETASHIQQPISMDFILPNVKLTSSIREKYGWELTDVETGCLISSLKELSMMQIGSAKRIGFGRLDWTIEMGGEVLFKTECNPDYVLEWECRVTEAGEKYIAAWEAWLKDENNANRLNLSDFEG